jgi:hypothetical protein
MFGLANSFFSACAFGGVVLAVILQVRQLAVQKQELDLATESMSIQTAIASITAQLSTTLQRRDFARSNFDKYAAMAPNQVVTMPDGNKPAGDLAAYCQSKVGYLTDEVDKLTARLKFYEDEAQRRLPTSMRENLDRHVKKYMDDRGLAQ